MHSLAESFHKTRTLTGLITAPLFVEDYCIQSMPDVSPPKWHLGHTTWFFETFLLEKYLPHYKSFNKDLHQVFNSYYNEMGPHWKQAERGSLSRPGVNEVHEYRKHVDKYMMELLAMDFVPPELVILGINHEQQHQELLYMDIKNILFNQYEPQKYWGIAQVSSSPESKNYIEFSGGLVDIGYDGPDFAYDNEMPVHSHYLHPFKLRQSLVTNIEYLDFIECEGYQNPSYWLSDGWDWVQQTKASHPLYWLNKNSTWYEYDFAGLKELVKDKPVSHVNYYEASAYARFRNQRLPTEQEWEFAAKTKGGEFKDLQESLWQWTSSAYSPYPGHVWENGAVGEYNSKFMVNQMVLRGGSAWTPEHHLRKTYRNFFHPDKKWAFTGIRLAEDSKWTSAQH